MLICDEECIPFCINCANYDSGYCRVKGHPVSEANACNGFICNGVMLK